MKSLEQINFQAGLIYGEYSKAHKRSTTLHHSTLNIIGYGPKTAAYHLGAASGFLYGETLNYYARKFGVGVNMQPMPLEIEDTEFFMRNKSEILTDIAHFTIKQAESDAECKALVRLGEIDFQNNAAAYYDTALAEDMLRA